ncbi:MAG: hypothetical protein ACI4UF_08265, partial [Thermoguttaceae bacterium]
ECGNTEAEGFLCRFRLATEKCIGKKRFFSWETSNPLQRQTPLRGGIAAKESGECRLRDCITALHMTTLEASSP